jgi:hypothetical protein
MRRCLVVWGGGAVLVVALQAAAGCAQSGRVEGCDPACPMFSECCDTPSGPRCVDVVNDRNNCGGCGTVCPGTMVCRAARCEGGDGGLPTDGGLRTDGGGGGMCSPACPDTLRCCGMRCVSRQVTVGTDGRSDPSFMNCNGCGIACDPTRASACSVPGGGSGAPQCMCGLFAQCSAGQVCVRDAAGDFVCTSTSTDPENCGEVGRRCPEGHSCIAGQCVCGSGPGATACRSGEACCGDRCVDTRVDSMNCGMCGRACGGGESCQGGMCVCGTGPRARACATPTMTSPGELCCGGACVPQDASNCGGCGMTCGSDEMCLYGSDFFGGGTMRWCCARGGFPGFPAFCTPGGGGFPDVGFPDGGIFPFP